MTATALSGATLRYRAGMAIFVTLILVAVPLCAQTTSGDIVGTVYDPSGAAIPGAKVEATNIGTGVKTTTTGNSAGEYQIRNLLIGNYKLTATADNFQTTSLASVAVQLTWVPFLGASEDAGSVIDATRVSNSTCPWRRK